LKAEKAEGQERPNFRPSSRGPITWAEVSFLDQRASQTYIERISSALKSDLVSALPALFSESPDPDSALILFDQLLQSSPETAHLIDRYHPLAHYALLVFGHSRFLGDTLVQNPDLLHVFLRERNLDRSFSREEFHEALARFRARSFQCDVSVLLSRFKRREYVRIMLRDVLKIAPLAETTSEISALSDVLIEDALREAESRLQRRFESPKTLDATNRLVDVPFAVLSLGKLGGNELNYSSDVDLLFLFGDGKEPPDAAISNREYFIRLAQTVTELLSQVTSEGAVFRIDLRLRPQGNEGELAIGLSQAVHYYSSVAHDWERQALIKIRHSAGNQSLAREFVRRIQTHIYKEQINFAAIKTALVAREKMHSNRRYKKPVELSGEGIDVKIDPGGIRDIEFLVQCLQRVYGGEEPWLRSGGTLFSLHKLHDKRHISGKEFHELTSAYEFLRHLEHRLQLRQGQQTHRLPLSGLELRILRRCMEGYEAGQYRVGDLVATVRRRMAAVAEIYQRIIYQQQTQRHQEIEEAEFRLRSLLEPSAADQSNQQILERLATDAPALYETAIRRDLSYQARKNLFRFFSAAFTTSERYSAVVRHPAAVNRALKLFDSSDYLTDILVRHPEEIASLDQWDETPSRLGMGQLFESVLGPAHAGNDPIVDYLTASELSHADKLALLRRHYRHRVFTSGARDIAEFRNVYRSLSAYTASAEDAIAAAYGIAGSPEGLAVLGVGRLGAGEFDILSDADLLFVCERDDNREEMVKAAAHLMQALAAYTQDGMVFPVDARLRPLGGDGELVFTPTHLAAYCENEAQPWEALTYTKLRFIAGSRDLGEATIAKTKSLFERFSADPGFLDAVREMRTRLEPEEQDYSFKTSRGGIYDIDFISGYLLVKHGIREKGGTLRDRLWRCAGTGVLERTDAATLDHAAELLRTVDHIARLVVGRANKWLPPTEHARQFTENLTSEILKRPFKEGLEVELIANFRGVRQVYDRIFGTTLDS
jgi:[glutamine synthetase] adenylyltransferase / [glutamine synthetase]-adenylyl-L-tyrosine phosphorylase